jgi:hypothetical protein
MKRITIEQLMKRRAKRKAAFEQISINREHLKNAVVEYLERLPTYQLKEIIDIDIPALTTELVEVKIYTKE